MAPRRHKPFTGILATPIEPIQADETIEQAFSRWVEGQHRRIIPLGVHYGINPNLHREEFLERVLIALATQFVRGFQMQRKLGRKGTPESLLADLELEHALDVAAADPVATVADAARRLGKERGKSADNLRERYYRLKDPLTRESQRLSRFKNDV